MAWSLVDVSFPDPEPLTLDELLRPTAPGAWTVRSVEGEWQAELVLPEPADIGTPSIAWHEWHVIWWWTNVHRSLDGEEPLPQVAVPWPGPGAARQRVSELHDRWLERLDAVAVDELVRGDVSAWPYGDDRPLLQTLGWVNIELMKNMGELHLLRSNR